MKKKFESLNIKGKLSFGYAIVIALMVFSGILSMIALGLLDHSLNEFVDKTNRADTAIKTIRVDTNITARTIREMALNEDTSAYPAYVSKVEEKMAEVWSEIDVLKATGVLDEALVANYEKEIQLWEVVGYEIIEKLEAGDHDAAVEQIFSECVPELDALIEVSLELDTLTEGLMQQSVSESQAIFWICLVVVIIFIILAVIVALQIGKKIIASITEPLQEIEAVAFELTNGNLHSSIEYHAQDEIGSLAHSLRKSLRILGSYVDDIANTMKEFSEGNFEVQPQTEWKGDFIQIRDSILQFEQSMADIMKSIHGAADQVSSGADQIAGSSTELASGATEQAGITEELAATILSASEELAQSADAAREISKKVESSGVEILKGNEKMQEMLGAMDEINDASEKISQIIDTINSIASQTNLLALNASIEAARAGEAGKGFAVVADQVSILAAQSADAAKESNVLIESSLAAVEKGKVIADDTAKQLEYVVADSQSIMKDIDHAADVLTSQVESFEQIIIGVDHINDVVQTNSATSEECAAASQEMSSQAEMLEELIRGIRILN